MFFTYLLLSLCVFSAIDALPTISRYVYAVKESHVVPRGWTEVGPVSKSEDVHLQIGLKQRNEGVIEQRLFEISDPNHERHGQHLTPAEVRDIVSPSSDAVKLVYAWLLDHEITEEDAVLSPSRDWISILLPISRVEQLLETQYKVFKHDESGETVSRAPEWSLPVDLHEYIDVVQPTTSFFRSDRVHVDLRKRSLREREVAELVDKRVSDNQAGKDPIFDVCSVHLTTPRCLRTLYGTLHYQTQAADKNSIAVTNYLNNTNRREDIQVYLKTFRPEIADVAYKFPIINIANASNDQAPLDNMEKHAFAYIEGDMDAELVLAISYPTPFSAYSTGGSPPFHKDLFTTTNTNEPYLTWLNYVLAQDNLPWVISNSYGDDEQTVPEAYARRVCAGFAQLAARGISVLFASNDHGVGEEGYCHSNGPAHVRKFLPSFPSTCPWVTSVGATRGFSPETATTYFASGGGFSDYFEAPSYQKRTVEKYIASLDGLHASRYNAHGRGYPDVAAQGTRDAVGWNDHVTWDGGTSASTPTFAAVIALVNDALLAKGLPTLGFLNSWLYSSAYRGLTDVTIGSSYGCNSSGFPAQEGWDAVTGFGTPKFRQLVELAFAKYNETFDGQGFND